MEKKKLIATLQRSYYGKAHVRTENGNIILTSYNTDVAMIDKNGNFHRLWSGWSRTTSMHVNDFRLQHGFPTLLKKAWLELPCMNAQEVYNVYLSTGFYTHKSNALLTAKECENTIAKVKTTRPVLYAWYD